MLGPGGTMSGMYFDDARGLRKKNRKWKLMQAYLPYLGWGLFSVMTVILVHREHRASGVGQSLQIAMQDLNVLKTSQSQLQSTNVRKDQTITQISSRLTKTERELKSSQARFQEEKKLLTSREEELLKAKAESIAAHTDLQRKHSQTQQEHSSAAEKASSCEQNLSKAKARVEELSKTLSQQYDVVAELKRNLDAETTLHTHNEKKWESKESDLRRQLSGLEEHHASCTTNSTAGHSQKDEPSSTASHIIDTVTHAVPSLPSREVLRQAHPGVAAAADLLLGQASRDKPANNSDAKLSPPSGNDLSQEGESTGQGQDAAKEIPWGQVAGLLHSQGITDPQGLEHMIETLKKFVGASLAMAKDRSDAAVDLSAQDDALVSLLAGAGISDPNGRAHFAQALRKHALLASQSDDTASELGVKDDRHNSRANLSDGPGEDVQLESPTQHAEATETQQAHGITSHGHRAFLIDDSNPATGSASDKSDQASKQV